MFGFFVHFQAGCLCRGVTALITRVTNPVMSRLLVLPNIRGVFLTLYPAARKKECTSLKGQKEGQKRGKRGKKKVGLGLEN